MADPGEASQTSLRDVGATPDPLAVSSSPSPSSGAAVPMPIKIELPPHPVLSSAAPAPGRTPTGVPNPMALLATSLPAAPASGGAGASGGPRPAAVTSSLGPAAPPSPLASPILEPTGPPPSALDDIDRAFLEDIGVGGEGGEEDVEPQARSRRRADSVSATGSLGSPTTSNNGASSLPKSNESLQPVNFGDGPSAQFSPGSLPSGAGSLARMRKLSNASSAASAATSPSSMGARTASWGSLHSEYGSECDSYCAGGGGSPGGGAAAVPGVVTSGVAAVSLGGAPATAQGARPVLVTSGATAAAAGGAGATTVDKRQKRLERNRESARASRRRRKRYLEELEVRVTRLSTEMDRGRMAHASAAVGAVRNMRAGRLRDAERAVVAAGGAAPASEPAAAVPSAVRSGIAHNVKPAAGRAAPAHRHSHATGAGSVAAQSLERAIRALASNLSRASDELQLVQTFMKQQLLSLVQPTGSRYFLWLSLQKDGYFRGGRSASERLSAARIGERVSAWWLSFFQT